MRVLHLMKLTSLNADFASQHAFPGNNQAQLDTFEFSYGAQEPALERL